MTAAGKGTMAVVQIDSDRIAAIQVSLRGARVSVDAACCVIRPGEVSADSPEAMGAWVKQALRDAGIGARRAILAAARSEVVLKVLDLPGGGIADDAERCEVVRLQMARQLTMPITESAIDWVPLGVDEDGRIASVLAGAIHTDRLGWYRSVAMSAGLKPIGVQLSSGGIATLAAEIEGSVLTVAPSTNGIEFVVATGGRVLFARSIDLPGVWGELGGDEAERERAERIAIEAKRTWMSYRVSQRAEDIGAVAVLGTGSSAERVRQACVDLMEVPGVCVGLPESVKVKDPDSIERNAPVFPLIGLALRTSLGAEGMDFLNPHQPPDLAAKRRTVVLGVLLGAIVLGGAGYLVRMDRLASLERTQDALKNGGGKLAENYLEYLGDLARVEHLERWDAMDADYLGHIGWLSAHLPDPSVSQADRIAMAMAGQVRYEGKVFPGGKWLSPSRLVISVSGKVHDRAVMLGLRDRLLREGPYVVANRGPDVADRFDYQLSTSILASPKAAKVPVEGADKTAPEELPGDATGEGP
jgi:hypothetical protein